jgi:GNAT superfamily N-acetyltransferase
VEVNIVEATEKDLPAVLAIYAQPTIDDSQVLPLRQAQDIFSQMRRYPCYKLYVALVGQEVVGTFALLVVENLAHMGASSGIIEDVAVRPDWQRRGIGTKMVKRAIDLCRDMGCYKLALSSNEKRGAAHAFYESLGFRRHGYSYLIDLD